MKRLREVSRFECDVRVLRNEFCGSALGFWASKAECLQGGV